MLYALFSWDGRLGRLAYFGYSILLVTILVVLGLVLLLPLRNAEGATGVTVAIMVILTVMGTVGGFCLAAKRLHDLDLSAWHYVWMVFFPAIFNGFGAAFRQLDMPGPALMTALLGLVISFGIGLYLLFWPGSDGANRFGERP
ncbi:DUF805 domain-containing protein [Dongia sedimenti]|uniref:DUF805 domain-containing protein n=1 Tax=Dongia sedimenti TaxID=3064282 RepID=A0ABU0YNI7_9PROT|nr:DUF805 domain-containing protein [Rhodospirillaceae bacterium R-7]